MNNMVDALISDFRYGARMLGANPGFTAAVVLILALGLGANSAVFSLVNAVLLKPLPYAGAERIYELQGRTESYSQWISAPDFLTWRAQTQAFETMAAGSHERYVLTGVPVAEEVEGLGAGRELLPMLGVAPATGRTFADDDYRDAAPRTALISDKLWRRQFAGDRNVLGMTILLNGTPHKVIGVMPPEFQFPEVRTEVWTPMTFSGRALSQRQWPAFMVWGRAKPGISKQHVEQEARFMAGSIGRDYPDAHRKGWTLTVAAFQDGALGHVRMTLLVVLGAVACVLLIACLNVASMLLARGLGRCKEMAIRTVLGAGRLRLVRQVLTESLMLSTSGGLVGLLVALWGKRALLALCSERVPLPRGEQAHFDAAVLGFTWLVSVMCAVAFGLAPALLASNVNLANGLKEGGRGMARSGRGWCRNVLIVAEMALSLVLLAGAGLMIRTVVGLMQVNPGFNPERVLTMRLPLPTFRVPDRKRQPLYYAEILQQVQAVPGVHSAALASALPLSGWSVTMSLDKPLVSRSGERHEFIEFSAVSPAYFRVMGIPMLMGRSFDERDTAGAPRVAIVNQAMAREFWPGEIPVGKIVPTDGNLLIVGVAGDVRHASLSNAPEPELYLPFLQGIGVAQSVLVVRASAPDPTVLLGAVQRRIRQASADQPIQEAATLRKVVSESYSEPRFYMVLLTVFAALALGLAAVGIYGVMSFSVSRREHEFGIRMAIGATTGDVLRSVLSRGAVCALIGIVMGIGGALATTRLMRNMLFGVQPADTPTYIVVSVILFGVALAACLVPARRAANVDPMVALRHE
jgi:putative ABC transport system permease protein